MFVFFDVLKGVWFLNGVGSLRFFLEIYVLGFCCVVVLVLCI